MRVARFEPGCVSSPRRPIFTLTLEGQIGHLHFNDPSAMAIASLHVTPLCSGPVLASFLETGGVDAALQMMDTSTCLLALAYTVDLIGGLVVKSYLRAAPGIRDYHVGDKLFDAGAWIHEAFCKYMPSLTSITVSL
jgi:hypothetical protein